MEKFKYKAIKPNGKHESGTIEAENEIKAIASLKAKGMMPMFVQKESLMSKDINIGFGPKVSLRDISIFCRQFATILNAGVSALSALEILNGQTTNKAFNKALASVHDNLQKGNSLHMALMENEDVFPKIMINMAHAGEISGNLDLAFDRMAVHFEKEYKLNNKVKSALTYPIVVSVVSLIVVVFLVVGIVPTFVDMFKSTGNELPITTTILVNTSNFIIEKWYIILIVLGILAGGIKYFSSTNYGRNILDGMALKMPVFGNINTKVAASRFARTLSTMIASGMPLLDSLDMVSNVIDNYVINKVLENVRKEVSRGVNISGPLEHGKVFPKMMLSMLKIGEDTGEMEKMLSKSADFYDEEVDVAVSQMTTMLEPAVICMLAVVVGFIVISIVQPMFGMMKGIG